MYKVKVYSMSNCLSCCVTCQIKALRECDYISVPASIYVQKAVNHDVFRKVQAFCNPHTEFQASGSNIKSARCPMIK